MLNHWTIVPLFVLGFLFLSLYLGIRAGKAGTRTTADHVVGGRHFGLLLVFFVSVGEIYSSVSFLGQPGWAYEHGAGMLMPVGTFIPLVSFWLGPKIWERGRRDGLLTQAQFFGAHFESQVLRGLTAFVTVFALIAYISVQMTGGGYVFNVTTQGRIPFWLGALMAFDVVAIYVYNGGLRAIGWVAVVKGLFMAGVGGYVVLRVVDHYYGGIGAMFHQIAERSPAHLTLPGPKHYVTFTFWTTSVLNSLCAFYMWPHMFANFYSAANARIIRRQAIFMPLYNLVTLAFLLVGFAGILAARGVKPDTIMVEMLVRIAPLWLVGLFCAGAVSASMVTGAAGSLAAAATLGNDLLQPRLQLPDQKLRRLIQVLVLVVIGAAYTLALVQPATIVYVILVAYGFTAQLFPLTLAALFSRRANAAGAITGVLSGFLMVALFTFWISAPYQIHPGILGLAVNIPSMLVVSRFTQRRGAQAAHIVKQA